MLGRILPSTWAPARDLVGIHAREGVADENDLEIPAEKIRIVLEGLRGETSIAELCRKEGIPQSMYYGWSKEFLEAGKKRLAGDTVRQATSDEVAEGGFGRGYA